MSKMKNENLMSAGGQRSAMAAEPSSRSFARAGGGIPITITQMLTLEELYKTDGSNTIYTVDIFDLPAVRALGPMIQQLRVHLVVEAATTNFEVKVSTGWSVLGRTWSASTDILSAQIGVQTGVMSNWLADDTKFGLLMRYAIEVKNSAGTAIESGRVTVILEIELKH